MDYKIKEAAVSSLKAIRLYSLNSSFVLKLTGQRGESRYWVTKHAEFPLLKSEPAETRMKRNILKKAIGIFGERVG